MHLAPRTIKNVLAVRNDRFGEFLLNIPAFRALKESFSKAKLTVILDGYVKEVAQAIPFIDQTIEWSGRKHPLREKIKFVKDLKKEKFDLAVMLNPSKELNLVTFFAGIPVRAGYNRKFGFLLTDRIPDNKYLGLCHEVEYNLELVNSIGASTKNNSLTLSIPDGIIDGLFKKIKLEKNDAPVVIHPFASDEIKLWGEANFLELARRLVKECNLTVVIVGGKENLALDRESFLQQSSKIINLMGQTTLMELAALLKMSRLLISGDSGPVHLASCVGTPVLALFKSDDPAKSARRWGPWGKGNIVIEKLRLADISVDEVFDQCKGVFGK